MWRSLLPVSVWAACTLYIKSFLCDKANSWGWFRLTPPCAARFRLFWDFQWCSLSLPLATPIYIHLLLTMLDTNSISSLDSFCFHVWQFPMNHGWRCCLWAWLTSSAATIITAIITVELRLAVIVIVAVAVLVGLVIEVHTSHFIG